MKQSLSLSNMVKRNADNGIDLANHKIHENTICIFLFFMESLYRL
jgi:hypothetical protein